MTLDEASTSAVEYKACLRQKLPLLLANETMSAYCRRVSNVLDHTACRVVSSMAQPGLYLYKRPVHSASQGNAGGLSAQSLLEHAGSIMHHIILFIKTSDQLSALEMGPVGSADVHDNIFEAVEAGPVHQTSAESPSEGPFLLIDVPTHPLSHPAVQQAISFAQGRKYHTLRGNCIQFADAMVRLLTGGAVFGAPLAYDALAGDVPPTDSPLLGMLSLTMQLTWVDVCDGAGVLADFLAAHDPPPQLAASLRLHTTTALPASSSGSSLTDNSSRVKGTSSANGLQAPQGGNGQTNLQLAALLGSLTSNGVAGGAGVALPDVLSGLLATLNEDPAHTARFK